MSTVKLKRTFTPSINVASSYTLKFSNEIFHPYTDYVDSVTSTQFSHVDDSNTAQIQCSLQDSNGIMQVYRTVGANRVIVANNVGTVNYTSGLVSLSNFKPTLITDGTANVEVTIALASSDITPIRDQILLITNNNISVINSFLLLQFLKLLYINTYGTTVPNNNDITKNGIINLDILGFTIFNIIKCPNPNNMTGIILAKSFSLANANSIPSFSFLSFLFFFK